jgi:hypothetical protein
MRALASPQREGIEPKPLGRGSASGVVDAFDLDALRQHDADEFLLVVEWTVVEPVAQHDGAAQQVRLKHNCSIVGNDEQLADVDVDCHGGVESRIVCRTREKDRCPRRVPDEHSRVAQLSGGSDHRSLYHLARSTPPLGIADFSNVELAMGPC